MKDSNNITNLSFLVLAQVILFVLVYVATIGLGAGLIYLIILASIDIIPPFIENVAPEIMRLGKAGFILLCFIAITIVGLYTFMLSIAIYLIKPIIIFPKRDKNYGKKINKEDSPELYDMIIGTAKAVGVKYPKNIYVNHEVNACVFFNTSFWNIFFPVRKNLAIGLGLFESTNTEEVKSILAHEFGHFAQGSMRIGSVLYISNKIITDLVYRRDVLDSLMLHWCLRSGVWGFWGKATQNVVIKFRNIVEFMYKKQQRNYMKLSRQMEYDADSVACRIAGSNVFVSALCKIQKLDKSFGIYNQVLINFANQSQTISNYWEGYELSLAKLGPENKISYDILETTPEIETEKSLVSIEEIWESHPSIENRINNARELNISINAKIIIKPAQELVSQPLKEEISSSLLQIFKDNDASISTISWSEFSEILSTKIKESIFPKEVEVFFNRDLIINNDDYTEQNPLDNQNQIIIKEYEQALHDMQTLNYLKKGKVPVTHFMYRGSRYNITNIPISEHEAYIQSLLEKVSKIDSAIHNLAKSKSSDITIVNACYDAIEYAQSVTKFLQDDFLPVRDDITIVLNKAQIAGEDDFESLREWLDSYESAIKDVVKNLKYRQIVPFMTKEEHEHMISFYEAPRSFYNSINNNAVKHMFEVTDWVMRVHENLSHVAKMVLVNIILDKELPDTKFLELWKSADNVYINENKENPTEYSKNSIHIDSFWGQLNLTVPTDEQIEEVCYQEWFRYRIWEKYYQLGRDQKFGFDLVATVLLKEDDDGHLTNVNQEDEQKFLIEIQEYHNFIKSHLIEPNWETLSTLADQGDAHANSRMSQLYYSQNQYDKAYNAAMKGALQGDDDSIVMLGILVSNGVDSNSELAVKLFKCAAHSGNMYALCNLGIKYANGIGIEKDTKKAICLFERAALQGNSTAQYNLGNMYLNGEGVDADSDNGLYWLYNAAINGNKEAVNTIWQYHKESGDTDQYIKVVMWGAKNGIEECRAEVDMINLSNNPYNSALKYNVGVNNPIPIIDTTITNGNCPVCGKPIEPSTTKCPHCNEVIWDPKGYNHADGKDL